MKNDLLCGLCGLVINKRSSYRRISKLDANLRGECSRYNVAFNGDFLCPYCFSKLKRLEKIDDEVQNGYCRLDDERNYLLNHIQKNDKEETDAFRKPPRQCNVKRKLSPNPSRRKFEVVKEDFIPIRPLPTPRNDVSTQTVVRSEGINSRSLLEPSDEEHFRNESGPTAEHPDPLPFTGSAIPTSTRGRKRQVHTNRRFPDGKKPTTEYRAPVSVEAASPPSRLHGLVGIPVLLNQPVAVCSSPVVPEQTERPVQISERPFTGQVKEKLASTPNGAQQLISKTVLAVTGHGYTMTLFSCVPQRKSVKNGPKLIENIVRGEWTKETETRGGSSNHVAVISDARFVHKGALQLWKDNLFLDLVLDINSIAVAMHKLVLAIASPFLKKINIEGKLIDRISIQVAGNVTRSTVEAFVNFLYTGQLVLTKQSVYSVKTLATALQMQKVEEVCSNFIDIISKVKLKAVSITDHDSLRGSARVGNSSFQTHTSPVDLPAVECQRPGVSARNPEQSQKNAEKYLQPNTVPLLDKTKHPTSSASNAMMLCADKFLSEFSSSDMNIQTQHKSVCESFDNSTASLKLDVVKSANVGPQQGVDILVKNSGQCNTQSKFVHLTSMAGNSSDRHHTCNINDTRTITPDHANLSIYNTQTKYQHNIHIPAENLDAVTTIKAEPADDYETNVGSSENMYDTMDIKQEVDSERFDKEQTIGSEDDEYQSGKRDPLTLEQQPVYTGMDFVVYSAR